MTTKEDIELLIERGYFEEALSAISRLPDPLDQIETLTDLALAIRRQNGPEDWALEIIEDALYVARKLRDTPTRTSAYARIAATLSKLGYYDEAAELFSESMEEAYGIENPIERGVVLSTLAYHLAVAGYHQEAYETFNDAFDTIIGAETDYNLKVEGILKIAELMEVAGDQLPAKEALNFYRMAFDIFDKLNVNQRAAIVEKKIKLTLTVYDVGLPQIRKALLEGRNHLALALIEKMYTGVSRLIGELEVALWMKRVNNPEYLDVMERAFEKCKDPRFTQTNVQKIAALLTELGSLRKALEFAMEIRDVVKRSEAMKAIALELARDKKFEDARKIANAIPDPKTKEETLTEIEALEESGE